MNIAKLTRWNMQHPINARLHVETIQEMTQLCAMRGKLFALQAEVAKDIAPELQAMRRADDFFTACVGRPKGPVDCEREPGSLSKYNVEYGQGSIPGDLASINSEFASLYRASLDKAREHTQTTAGGNHSQD